MDAEHNAELRWINSAGVGLFQAALKSAHSLLPSVFLDKYLGKKFIILYKILIQISIFLDLEKLFIIQIFYALQCY